MDDEPQEARVSTNSIGDANIPLERDVPVNWLVEVARRRLVPFVAEIPETEERDFGNWTCELRFGSSSGSAQGMIELKRINIPEEISHRLMPLIDETNNKSSLYEYR